MDRYNGRCHDGSFIWKYRVVSGWRSESNFVFKQIVSDKRGSECGSGSCDRWAERQFYRKFENEYSADSKKDQGYKVKGDPETDWNKKQDRLCSDVY